jgi:hypothetical protein
VINKLREIYARADDESAGREIRRAEDLTLEMAYAVATLEQTLASKIHESTSTCTTCAEVKKLLLNPRAEIEVAHG